MSDFFYELTPAHILDAVEKIGRRSTGRCFALNSLENRVYEVEMEPSATAVEAGDTRVVGKFYRPGRWTREQILEEHQFLFDLAAAEIPVAEPLKLQEGSTLAEAEGGILFAVFPKRRGRAPEELTDDQILQFGRLVGRLHNVGASRPAPHRLTMTPEVFGTKPLQYMLENGWLPPECASRYKTVVEEIIKISEPWFKNVKTHRIHGDCHLGNLLFGADGAFFLDFDDMVTGPAVQDLWLTIPGHEEDSRRKFDLCIQGYTEMREFERSTLRLIEPLRALRIVHYSAWIARRWKDPAFPRVFSEFNTHKYWESEIQDLNRQLTFVRQIAESH